VIKDSIINRFEQSITCNRSIAVLIVMRYLSTQAAVCLARRRACRGCQNLQSARFHRWCHAQGMGAAHSRVTSILLGEFSKRLIGSGSLSARLRPVDCSRASAACHGSRRLADCGAVSGATRHGRPFRTIAGLTDSDAKSSARIWYGAHNLDRGRQAGFDQAA
jgi:hypothetical protein